MIHERNSRQTKMSDSIELSYNANNVGTSIKDNELPMPSSRSNIDFAQDSNRAASYRISFSKKALVISPNTSIMKCNPIVTSLMRS